MTPAGEFHQSWRALPVGTLDDVIGSGTCLVLAPHPDDESLGCGGLIAACVAAARPPLVVILTDGAGSHNSPSYPAERLRAVREQEAREAVAYLGLPPDRIVFLNQPDTKAPSAGPSFNAVVAELEALVQREPACTAILAPWLHDPHCDHEAAAVIAAAVATQTSIKSVAYPVWGWTLPSETLVPASLSSGWRLDIAAFLEAKREAIFAHQSQYGGLITDDPGGFQLPTALLAAFDGPFEVFLQP
jgi:LmbE family N-acetylglucosaminyl deacetylase